MSLFTIDNNTHLDTIFQTMLSEPMKKIVVTSIIKASDFTRDLSLDFINIPSRGRYLAGMCFPVLIDKCLTTVLDNMNINVLKYEYYSQKVPKGSYRYIEYRCPFGKFHIKKVNKKDALPKAAAHRISNAETNKIFLDLGENYTPKNINVPFGLITYTHKNFHLKSINFGFPNYEYTAWQNNKLWNLTLDCSSDIANIINKQQLFIKTETLDKVEQILPSYGSVTKK